MIFRKIVKKLLCCIPVLLNTVFASFTFLILSGSTSFKFEKFYKDVFAKDNYVYGTYEPEIVNIKKNDEILYNPLFDNLYYNSLVSEARLLINNNVTDSVNKIKFYTQSAFSIRNSSLPGGGHYIDYGIFASYYADDILGPRKYLEHRFGCDSFVFISDTYADILLKKYNINSYEELIQNKEYAVLNLNVDGITSTKVCINNILYSNKRQGPRAKELYGNFALIYNNNQIQKWSSTSIDIDLKSNPYGVKRVLKSINSFGYNTDNSDITFSKYNESIKSYEIDTIATNNFKNLNVKNDSLYTILFFILCFVEIAAIVLYYIFVKDSKTRRISLILVFAAFAIFGLVCNYTYLYPYVSIIPILSVLFSLFLCRKEVANDFKYLFGKIFRTKIERDEDKFISIEI